MHECLIEKNQKLFDGANHSNPKKKRKKKKGRKGLPASLEWWGLAEKFVASKKYRMPTPPK